MKQSFADVSDEKYGRSKSMENYSKISREIYDARAQKRNIGKTGEDERERGEGELGKKIKRFSFRL